MPTTKSAVTSPQVIGGKINHVSGKNTQKFQKRFPILKHLVYQKKLLTMWISIMVGVIIFLIIWVFWIVRLKRRRLIKTYSDFHDVESKIEMLDKEIEKQMTENENKQKGKTSQATKKTINYHVMSGGDPISTRLNLARAYIDMGDQKKAKELLNVVLQQGDEEQKQEANELLKQL